MSGEKTALQQTGKKEKEIDKQKLIKKAQFFCGSM